MPPGRIRFIYAGIRVRSLERSLKFYRGLGFRILRRGTMEHGGRWVHLKFPPSPQVLELNYYPPSNRFAEKFRPGTDLDHLGFYADDVEAWAKKAERLGARRTEEFEEGSSRLVYVRDPDGIWLEFFGPRKPPRPSKRKKTPH